MTRKATQVSQDYFDHHTNVIDAHTGTRRQVRPYYQAQQREQAPPSEDVVTMSRDLLEVHSMHRTSQRAIEHTAKAIRRVCMPGMVCKMRTMKRLCNIDAIRRFLHSILALTKCSKSADDAWCICPGCATPFPDIEQLVVRNGEGVVEEVRDCPNCDTQVLQPITDGFRHGCKPQHEALLRRIPDTINKLYENAVRKRETYLLC